MSGIVYVRDYNLAVPDPLAPDSRPYVAREIEWNDPALPDNARPRPDYSNVYEDGRTETADRQITDVRASLIGSLAAAVALAYLAYKLLA